MLNIFFSKNPNILMLMFFFMSIFDMFNIYYTTSKCFKYHKKWKLIFYIFFIMLNIDYIKKILINFYHNKQISSLISILNI